MHVNVIHVQQVNRCVHSIYTWKRVRSINNISKKTKERFMALYFGDIYISNKQETIRVKSIHMSHSE